jgi:hypothetical protein
MPRGGRSRPGWIRTLKVGRKFTRFQLHGDVRGVVEHCGHPTANYPWAAYVDGKLTLAPNGRAFKYLTDAQIAVEERLKEVQQMEKKQRKAPKKKTRKKRVPGDVCVCADCGKTFDDPGTDLPTDRCPEHYYAWAESEIAQLTKRIADLDADLDAVHDLTDEHETLKNEHRELRNEHDELEGKFTDSVNEADELRQERNELESDLKDARAALATCRKELIKQQAGAGLPADGPIGAPTASDPGETWGPFYWMRDAGTTTPADVVVGNIDIGGMPHHAVWIRVLTEDGEQSAADEAWEGQIDDLWRLAQPDGPMATMELPGRSGRYLLCLYPHDE